jgi:hypothetical protein
MPKRVLFARIGWMTYYAGPQRDDDRPKGGGGYNKKNVGHEVFNFTDLGGRLYGTARAKNGRINLARIDPDVAGAQKLDDVLIIFVARQHIVGWYRGAIVYAATNPTLPISVTKEMTRRLRQSGTRGFKIGGYRFEAAVETAVLLPTYERKYEVPGNVKGGIGRSNICYSYRNNGKSKKSGWMDKAIKYVLSYSRSNLLNAPNAAVNSEEAATVAQEQAAGFQSNPEIRKVVEQHAMKKAHKALEKRGYGQFVDTSVSNAYDYTCRKSGKAFFVEVKGTQTSGKSVILTKNEVEHIKANPGTCILVVVHSVKMAGKKVSKAGTADITEKWQLTDGKLTATQYIWKR